MNKEIIKRHKPLTFPCLASRLVQEIEELVELHGKGLVTFSPTHPGISFVYEETETEEEMISRHKRNKNRR
jgi:hypothetical protein